MAKTKTPDCLRLQVGRLRAFADVTTRGNPACDAILLQLLREVALDDRSDLITIYAELYPRLSALPPGSGCRLLRKPFRGRADWVNLQALRMIQRSALFLVIGLEFSLKEAALVLGQTEDELALEVVSAMLSLDHPLTFGTRAFTRTTRPEALVATGYGSPHPPSRPAKKMLADERALS